ncbi:MAG: hypothetical protein J0H69_08600 [Burkholderiales bacterium]|nr:hypothetical protein [Burkholderiales bacterium]
MDILLGGMAVIFLIGLWLNGYFWPLVIGGVVGSFFGVAGFGGAVSGMLPGAIIGGVIAVAMKKNKKEGTK